MTQSAEIVRRKMSNVKSNLAKVLQYVSELTP